MKEGNKRPARSNCNLVLNHFGHASYIWTFSNLNTRRQYQIYFASGLMLPGLEECGESSIGNWQGGEECLVIEIGHM